MLGIRARVLRSRTRICGLRPECKAWGTDTRALGLTSMDSCTSVDVSSSVLMGSGVGTGNPALMVPSSVAGDMVLDAEKLEISARVSMPKYEVSYPSPDFQSCLEK